MYLLPSPEKLLMEQIVNVLNDLTRNNGTTLVLILTATVIITAFILLFDRKEKDRIQLYAAFALIVIATFLITAFSPVKEWNTLVTAALLTPIFAFFINFLNEKQKLSSEKDKLVWTYKCQQLQNESDVISELLGELSIHAAAFKSPYYSQEIETQKWKNSFKASVISELHTLSIARYYNYIRLYNNLIPKYNRSIEQKKPAKKPIDLKGILEDFQALKKAFLDAESIVFLILTYDLGYLQQNYLTRPTDEFPIHGNLMFIHYLEKIRLIKNGEKIQANKIFSPESSKRFNKKVVIDLNSYFHKINLQLRSINAKLPD